VLFQAVTPASVEPRLLSVPPPPAPTPDCEPEYVDGTEVVVVDAAVLAVCDEESDAEVEPLVDAGAADSLVAVDAEVDAGAADSLVAVDAEVDPGAADSLDDSEGAADSLAAAGATDSLLESDGVVELLVDSDAADSLVLCGVDSLVDSVAESLVGPVLPGVRTVLPSVARVFRFAAATSYETGVMSDMSTVPRRRAP
jgi:hypothetical protein